MKHRAFFSGLFLGLLALSASGCAGNGDMGAGFPVGSTIPSGPVSSSGCTQRCPPYSSRHPMPQRYPSQRQDSGLSEANRELRGVQSTMSTTNSILNGIANMQRTIGRLGF